MRDSMIIYRSFFEAIKELPEIQQAKAWNAIYEYSLNNKHIELTGMSKTVFTLIKPQLDANLKKYENGKKAKQKQTGSKTEANEYQNESKIVANVNVNVNDNVNEQSLILDFNLDQCKLEKDTIGYRVMAFSKYLHNKFLEKFPNNRDLPLIELKEWIVPVRSLIERKKYTEEQIEGVCIYAVNDTKFWSKQILDTKSLEKHFEKIKIQYQDAEQPNN
jgi:hypothetical protein